MNDEIAATMAGYDIPTCCSHRRLLIDEREEMREALSKIEEIARFGTYDPGALRTIREIAARWAEPSA